MAFAAAKLKELRAKTGKSLQEVATEVGASKAHIWELETGRAKNPSVELLTKLADCFGVGLSDLVGENPEADGEQPELVAMFRHLKELTPADLETVRSMILHFKNRDK